MCGAKLCLACRHVRTSLQGSLKLTGSLMDGPVLEEGHVLFSVEGDRALAVCTCLSGVRLWLLTCVCVCTSFGLSSSCHYDAGLTRRASQLQAHKLTLLFLHATSVSGCVQETMALKAWSTGPLWQQLHTMGC